MRDRARLQNQRAVAIAKAQWDGLDGAAKWPLRALFWMYVLILPMVWLLCHDDTVALMRSLMKYPVLVKYIHMFVLLLIGFVAGGIRWGFWGCLKACWNGVTGLWRYGFHTWSSITLVITFAILIQAWHFHDGGHERGRIHLFELE